MCILFQLGPLAPSEVNRLIESPRENLFPIGIITGAAFAFLGLGVVLLPRLSSSVIAVVVIPIFVLVLPGYSCLKAFFPAWPEWPQSDADGIQPDGAPSVVFRVAMSVALSVAVATFVGVGLHFVGFPITRESVALVLFLVSISGLSVGYARHRSRCRTRGESQQSGSTVKNILVEIQEGSLASNIVPVLVIVAVLASVTLVATSVHAPNEAERYTEVSILSPNDSGEPVAGGFPDEMRGDDVTAVIANVQNEEHEHTQYTLVIVEQAMVSESGSYRVGEQVKRRHFSIALAPNESWSAQYRFSPTLDAKTVRVSFLLYRTEQPNETSLKSAYREVHFWTNVTAPQSNEESPTVTTNETTATRTTKELDEPDRR